MTEVQSFNLENNKFTLSSYNYGSFYSVPKKNIYSNQGIENTEKQNKQEKLELNKYGKRELKESEKIITTDFIKAAKEFESIQRK